MNQQQPPEYDETMPQVTVGMNSAGDTVLKVSGKWTINHFQQNMQDGKDVTYLVLQGD